MKNKHTQHPMLYFNFRKYMHFSCIFKHLSKSFQIVFAYLRNLCYNISVIFILCFPALSLCTKAATRCRAFCLCLILLRSEDS